jgi:exoribonuclease R
MTERRSERAVRECEGRMLAMFMRRNLSKEFEATVTQINGKKLWVLVEEQDVSIKTEISAKDLPKDLYDYSNGDKVYIQPIEANEVTGVIKFRMV